jgi:hypothetical protein
MDAPPGSIWTVAPSGSDTIGTICFDPWRIVTQLLRISAAEARPMMCELRDLIRQDQQVAIALVPFAPPVDCRSPAAARDATTPRLEHGRQRG